MAEHDPGESERQAGRGGPRTPEGKERSSANALKSGCTARKHVEKAIGKEIWQKTLREFREAWCPVGPVEDLFVEELARDAVRSGLTWDMQRGVVATLASAVDSLGITAKQGLEAAEAKIASSPVFAKAELYSRRAWNSYLRNVKALMKFRASRLRDVTVEVVDREPLAGAPAGGEDGPERREALTDLDDIARAIETRGCESVLWDIRAAALGETGAERPADWRERLEKEIKRTYIGHTNVDRAKALLVGGAITADPRMPFADIRRRSGIRRNLTVQRLCERIRTADARRDWVLAGLEVLLDRR